MAVTYLKKAGLTAKSDATDVRANVQKILSDIEQGGDQAALDYAAKFDQYSGMVALPCYRT